MKKVFYFFLIFINTSLLAQVYQSKAPLAHTFSIVGRDSLTG